MVLLEGDKIISASEMARIEKVSILEGACEKDYMLLAGKEIAKAIDKYIKENNFEKVITLLVGKGNNGGDALCAGINLQLLGYQVSGYIFCDMACASSLCKDMGQVFVQQGGKLKQSKQPHLSGVIIDGIFGIGFKGQIEGQIYDVIERANHSNLPILSIDIPSGIDGDSGKVGNIAIKASQTIYLELLKDGATGYDASKYVGIPVKAHFGLDQRYVDQANSNSFFFDHKIASLLLPKIHTARHKYQTGYVLSISGSKGMTGAGILSSYAALKSGAGIVRLFYTKDSEQELGFCPIEIVKTKYRKTQISKIICESRRSKACIIGPGLGKSYLTRTFLKKITSRISQVQIIDADALLLLKHFPKNAILTPHRGEMEYLIGKKKFTPIDCQQISEKYGVTIVLKGYPTQIYHPNASNLVIYTGDPGMATAGSGDVLTGIIAALCAQGLENRQAAALGVFIHGLSGELAAKELTSYSLIASDIIHFLPKAFDQILKTR